MTTYTLKDISESTDRHRLFLLRCNAEKMNDAITFIKSQSIPTINIGLEVAAFIDKKGDYKYLNIDVYDFVQHILDIQRQKEDGTLSNAIAIHNLGILLEPALGLNAAGLFKEFSKSTALIIIWENQIDEPDRLIWSTQADRYFFDFADTPLKKLQYEVQ